jgi:hypothetical protein
VGFGQNSSDICNGSVAGSREHGNECDISGSHGDEAM